MIGWVARVNRRVMFHLRRARNDDAVIFIGLFVTCVLVNGILAILLIEMLQALGRWPSVPEAEGTSLVEWRPQLRARSVTP